MRVLLRGRLVLAGVVGGSTEQRGGRVYAGELRRFEQICLGGEEEIWLWQCMQTYMAGAKPGCVCGGGLESQTQG